MFCTSYFYAMWPLYHNVVLPYKALKLYCGNEYTKLCIINCIWGLNNYDFRWMVMLDFICNGSLDLFGTMRERKIQNQNICLQRDSNPHHASPRQESQRLRPLGHDGLMVISGLMSYRITGYKFKKNYYVITRVKLIMVTCVFELNVRLNFHFLSQCRF